MKTIEEWKRENIGGMYTPGEEDIDELVRIVRDDIKNKLLCASSVETLTAQVAELREALEELSGKIDAYYFDDKYQSYIEDLLKRTKLEEQQQ